MTATDTNTSQAASGDRYRVLLDIGRSLAGTLSHEDLYDSIHRETTRIIEADGFYIARYDPESDLATVVFWADQEGGRSATISYPGSRSEVIRTGRPTIVEDRLTDRSLMVIGEEGKEATRSAISAPLRSPRGVIGAISAQSYRPRAYSPEHLELLQGIADIAAVAIENAGHVSQLEQRRREAETMEEIVGVLVSSLEVEKVLGTVAEAALKLLEADGSSIWLLEEQTAKVAASRGAIAPEAGFRIPLEGKAVRILMEERRPVVVENLPDSPLVPATVKESLEGTSGLVVPMISGDRLTGALSVGTKRQRSFTADDARLLQRLAGHAAVALETARLHASLQALSLQDPLTALPNRRHLEMHLDREFAAAERGRQLSVVLFDLDNFKQYNDALGHVAGDEVLRTLGEVMAGETRAMNLVARYGGDEFVAVLSDTPLEGARLHARRVEERVARHSGLGPHGITVSSGVATYAESMESPEDLIRAADQNMYNSKASEPPE
jgi:diguanylate cyclase (GGDEF)-like protein